MSMGMEYCVRDRKNIFILAFWADCDESLAMLKECLTDDPDKVNAQTDAGYTPVMRAIDNGNNHSLKILLQRGADLAIPDGRGRLAGHHACCDAGPGKIDCLSLLIKEESFDPLVKDSAGQTSFDISSGAARTMLEKWLRKKEENDCRLGLTMATTSGDDVELEKYIRKAKEIEFQGVELLPAIMKQEELSIIRKIVDVLAQEEWLILESLLLEYSVLVEKYSFPENDQVSTAKSRLKEHIDSILACFSSSLGDKDALNSYIAKAEKLTLTSEQQDQVVAAKNRISAITNAYSCLEVACSFLSKPASINDHDIMSLNEAITLHDSLKLSSESPLIERARDSFRKLEEVQNIVSRLSIIESQSKKDWNELQSLLSKYGSLIKEYGFAFNDEVTHVENCLNNHVTSILDEREALDDYIKHAETLTLTPAQETITKVAKNRITILNIVHSRLTTSISSKTIESLKEAINTYDTLTPSFKTPLIHQARLLLRQLEDAEANAKWEQQLVVAAYNITEALSKEDWSGLQMFLSDYNSIAGKHIVLAAKHSTKEEVSDAKCRLASYISSFLEGVSSSLGDKEALSDYIKQAESLNLSSDQVIVSARETLRKLECEAECVLGLIEATNSGDKTELDKYINKAKEIELQGTELSQAVLKLTEISVKENVAALEKKLTKKAFALEAGILEDDVTYLVDKEVIPYQVLPKLKEGLRINQSVVCNLSDIFVDLAESSEGLKTSVSLLEATCERLDIRMFSRQGRRQILKSEFDHLKDGLDISIADVAKELHIDALQMQYLVRLSVFETVIDPKLEVSAFEDTLISKTKLSDIKVLLENSLAPIKEVESMKENFSIDDDDVEAQLEPDHLFINWEDQRRLTYQGFQHLLIEFQGTELPQAVLKETEISVKENVDQLLSSAEKKLTKKAFALESGILEDDVTYLVDKEVIPLQILPKVKEGSRINQSVVCNLSDIFVDLAESSEGLKTSVSLLEATCERLDIRMFSRQGRRQILKSEFDHLKDGLDISIADVAKELHIDALQMQYLVRLSVFEIVIDPKLEVSAFEDTLISKTKLSDIKVLLENSLAPIKEVESMKENFSIDDDDVEAQLEPDHLFINWEDQRRLTYQGLKHLLDAFA